MKYLFAAAAMSFLPHNAIADIASSQAVNLQVGLVSPKRIPYYWVDQNTQEVQGLYVDILDKVSELTDIQFDYQFYPQARLRKLVKSGQLDLEPGIDASWRMEEGEAEASVYTDIFMQSNEVYVFAPEHHVKSPNGDNLKSKVGCGVNGFNFFDNGNRQIEFEPTTEQQVLMMVAMGRCHYVLVPEIVADHWLTTNPYNITVSEDVVSYDLRFRLHKQHHALLDEVNQAINTLKQSGELQALIAKYQ